MSMLSPAAAPLASPVAIPLGDVLPWAIFAGLMLMLAVYFVGTEQGAMAMFSGSYVHEFVHRWPPPPGFPLPLRRPDMTGKLLLRGMIAGVVGGLLAFLFAPHLWRAAHRFRHRLRGAGKRGGGRCH